MDHVGGPATARNRALRRLLSSRTVDVYVVDRAGSLDGIVAVHYRRSLAHGGMLATIDAMISLRQTALEGREDLALLTECALVRARRRGCVGIDSGIDPDDARRTLQDNGFTAGPAVLGRSLRGEGGAG